MDKEAQQATVHRVTKSQTWRKWPRMHGRRIFSSLWQLFWVGSCIEEAQLLGSWRPWQCRICRSAGGCHRGYDAIRALSSLWQLCPSEDWAWRWCSCSGHGDPGGAKCAGTLTASGTGAIALSESFSSLWQLVIRRPICPTLSDPMDCILPGSSVHCLLLSPFSCVQIFATLWTIACWAPLSMGLSRQEYLSGLPFPPPGDLPNPGIEPAFAERFFTTSPTLILLPINLLD